MGNRFNLGDVYASGKGSGTNEKALGSPTGDRTTYTNTKLTLRKDI